jgi:hypothetical protein
MVNVIDTGTKCHFNINDVKNYAICTATRELSVNMCTTRKTDLSPLMKSRPT